MHGKTKKKAKLKKVPVSDNVTSSVDKSHNLKEEKQKPDYIDEEQSRSDESKTQPESETEAKDTDDDMMELRKQLMDMPFEELEKLKEKIGVKAYRQALFGCGNSDSKPKKRVFKRENKNRPQEISSKRRVPILRQGIAKQKKVHRDPRFDDLSGEYNEHFFKQAYSFIGDVRQREKMKLMKKYKKEKDTERKQQMASLLTRMDQQEQSERDKDTKKKRDIERKKKERQLVKEGKKPYYLKKSEKKKLDLAEKYRELKKSGKVDKYLQRKRKKNAGKEKRHLPNKPS